MTKAHITQRLHSGHRDDYAHIGGVYITARQRGEAYVSNDGEVLAPIMKPEVTLLIGSSTSDRQEMSVPLVTLRAVIDELTTIADAVERGLRLPDQRPASTLLFTDEHGDTMFMGDVAQGRVLAEQDRYFLEEQRTSGHYTVEFYDSETGAENLTNQSEWGTGKTEEEAWRLALGAYFGPDDDAYDEDYLRKSLALGRWFNNETDEFEGATLPE